MVVGLEPVRLATSTYNSLAQGTGEHVAVMHIDELFASSVCDARQVCPRYALEIAALSGHKMSHVMIG